MPKSKSVKSSKQARFSFWETRRGLALLGLISFGLAWLMWLRASDTGSLQQYFILLVLVIYGANRLVHALRHR